MFSLIVFTVTGTLTLCTYSSIAKGFSQCYNGFV